ncbi:hypothetical protein JZ751_029258, partial [Albula glossodonta]
MVDFSSGDTEVIPLGSLITVGGAGPCPPLRVGDCVLVGSGMEGAGDCFVPGVVIATPRRLEAEDKLHTIFKYDNRKVHSLRNKMFKISQTRYKLTCHHLQERHRELHQVNHRMRTGRVSPHEEMHRKSSQSERRKENQNWSRRALLRIPPEPALCEDRDLESKQSTAHSESDD